MIEQYARVEALDDQTIRLHAETQTTTCHSCNAHSACGASLIARLFPHRTPNTLQLPVQSMPQSVKVGDRLLLGISEGSLHQAVMLLYALPLLGLLGGALSGAWLGGYAYGAIAAEPASILAGLLGLSAGIAYARYRSLRYASAAPQHIQVLKVMPAAPIPVVQPYAKTDKSIDPQG